MKRFIMNGLLWKVETVPQYSDELIDRLGTHTEATTDTNTQCIYLSDSLSGNHKTTVLLHELSHCMMFSYGYIDMIAEMTYPEYRIDMEELICNLIADRAYEIFCRAYDIVGDEAIHFVPYYMERIAF